MFSLRGAVSLEDLVVRVYIHAAFGIELHQLSLCSVVYDYKEVEVFVIVNHFVHSYNVFVVQSLHDFDLLHHVDQSRSSLYFSVDIHKLEVLP